MTILIVRSTIVMANGPEVVSVPVLWTQNGERGRGESANTLDFEQGLDAVGCGVPNMAPA